LERNFFRTLTLDRPEYSGKKRNQRERGKGKRRETASRRPPLTGAPRKSTAPKDAAARPLDGGALTRKGNARTGEGGSDGATTLCPTVCSGSRHVFLLFLRRRSRLWKKGRRGEMS
jgi:hypothetical protein